MSLKRSCYLFALLIQLLSVATGFSLFPSVTAAQPSTNRGVPSVPSLPEGSPQQLLQFIDNLTAANVKPSSREEMIAYMRDVAAVSLQAANKILAQVKPTDSMHERASKMKLESLMMLGRFGDEKAAAEMAKYALTLVDSPSKELAKEAQRLVIVSDYQNAISANNVQSAQVVVRKMATLLMSDPNDEQTAGLATQLAGALEHMPGGEVAAADAYRKFGPLLAKSSNEQIQKMGESFAGTMRRLSLPGHPMEISGTLLNGQRFDPKTLAGKVVLVEFWATWCGPCVDEIPNVREQYDKYHKDGFEVVGISLDQERETLERFVAEQNLPWPILFEEPEGDGWQHPLATFYGISGIPTVVLIGRDGKVITLDARGASLKAQLDALFQFSVFNLQVAPDAPDTKNARAIAAALAQANDVWVRASREAATYKVLVPPSVWENCMKQLLSIKTRDCPADFREAWEQYLLGAKDFCDLSAKSGNPLDLASEAFKGFTTGGASVADAVDESRLTAKKHSDARLKLILVAKRHGLE
jgi:thiol-disulfide isomerase/thioredoxin